MIETKTDNWFVRTAAFLGNFPESYLCLDVETQGVDVKPDGGTLITQVGWAKVVDRELVSHGELMLDWTRPELGVDQRWLAESIARTQAGMAKRVAAYHTTVDALKAQGVDPREALEVYRAMIADAMEDGVRVVGHNFYKFDRPLIEQHIRKHCSQPVRFEPALIFDTMLVERARLLKLFPPDPGSMSIARWYDQVAADRRRVKCSLSVACPVTYGYTVDASQAHGASYDCRVNAILLEAMRKLLEK